MKTINLNADQKNALSIAIETLSQGKPTAIIGAAGTGKSTMAAEVARVAMKECGISDVVYMAPTNKAALVLQEKCGSGYTIHSSIYKYDDEGNHFVNYDKDAIKNSLLIVDEASMVGEKLLKDLRSFAEYNNDRLLFLGDPFQLPPVKDGEAEIFNLECQATLNQIMRQANGSEILDYATCLRSVKKPFMPKDTNGDVEVIGGKEVFHHYVDDVKADKNVVLVVWTNPTRVKTNGLVRRALGYKDTVVNGDILISISNNNACANGETFVVDGVEHAQTIETADGKVVTFETVVNGKRRPIALYPFTTKASIPNFKVNARSFPENFQDRNRKDKKIVLSNNVVIATYGYAITAHKSQGSQWDTVYIGEVQKAFKEITEENCARWIYTAVTRAAKKVVLSSDLKLQKKVWKVIDDEAAKYVVDAPVGEEPVEEKPSFEEVFGDDAEDFEQAIEELPDEEPKHDKDEYDILISQASELIAKAAEISGKKVEEVIADVLPVSEEKPELEVYSETVHVSRDTIEDAWIEIFRAMDAGYRVFGYSVDDNPDTVKEFLNGHDFEGRVNRAGGKLFRIHDDDPEKNRDKKEVVAYDYDDAVSSASSSVVGHEPEKPAVKVNHRPSASRVTFFGEADGSDF